MINKKYGISANQISQYGFKLCLEVYEKYNRKCSVCGSVDYLAIHHIDGKGRNYANKGLEPNNNIDNLQLICRVCHGKVHGSAEWKNRVKYGHDCTTLDIKKIEYKQVGRKNEYNKEYYLNNKNKWTIYHKNSSDKGYFKEYYQKHKVGWNDKKKQKSN